MASRKAEFLQNVLGADGARALLLAAERSQELENALVPRTIMSWVDLMSLSFEGAIPGLANTYLAFQKHEDNYSGSISIGDHVFDFENATRMHVVATVGVAMGVDAEAVDPELRDLDLMRLGKSIDLLAKAKHVAKQIQRKAAEDLDEDAEKAELPGSTAKPTVQGAPLAPTPPQKQGAQPKPGKAVPKLPGIKVMKSWASNGCRMCGRTQMLGSAFKGCACFADLAKSVHVSTRPDGYELSFGSDWNRDSVHLLLRAFRGD